jgi:hypothetical protein
MPKFPIKDKIIITVDIPRERAAPPMRGLILPDEPIDYLVRRIFSQTGFLPFFVTSAGSPGDLLDAITISNPRTLIANERWGIQAGDIAVMVIETAAETISIVSAGWAEVSDSPIFGSGHGLTIFWKRIAHNEPDVTTTDSGNHQNAFLMWFRGCVETGNPFDVTESGGTGTGTTVTVPGDTTTVDNTMEILVAGSSRDSGIPNHFSFGSNADLQNLKERFDFTTSTGSGGGFGIATAEKASAGAFADTIVTLDSSEEWTAWTGALKPGLEKRPYFFPANQYSASFATNPMLELKNNDLVFIFCESYSAAPSTPAGWSLAGGCPVSNGNTILTVFWKRTTGTETYPTLSGFGDHVAHFHYGVRGAIESGDPFDFAGAAGTGTGTSITLTGGTTTVNKCLFLVAASASNINSTAVFNMFSAWSNASINNFTAREDRPTNVGDDGTIALAGGYRETAGVIGNTTATIAVSSDWAGWVCAIKPRT